MNNNYMNMLRPSSLPIDDTNISGSEKGGAGVAILIIFGSIAALVILFIATYIGKYNTLNSLNQNVETGKSRIASAVNTCSEKIKTIWTMADQEGLLEKDTYVKVAEARSAVDTAKADFDKAKNEKSTSAFDLSKLASNFGQAMVNVRVAFEAYPQLKTSETYQKSMTVGQEGFNEIKTALDDFAIPCNRYNTFRGSFVTNWFATSFNWNDKFPEKAEYYTGGIEDIHNVKVTTESLNPKSAGSQK